MKRAEHQPETRIVVYGGVFTKTHRVQDAGTVLPQHAHAYDHQSLIATGAVKAWAGDEYLGLFVAPDIVQIAANTLHKFQTVDDWTTIICVHAVGEAEDVEITAEHALELED